MAINLIRLREISDIVIGTLDDYGDPSFTQVVQKLARYIFYGDLLPEERLTIEGGAGIKRQIMTDMTEVAAAVGVHQARDVQIEDHLSQLDVQWKHYNAYWAFGTLEVFHNRGKALITNVIRPREANALISLAGKIESDGWNSPASTDEKTMYGIPYWVVYNATDGFTGGAASGHTTKGGINPGTKTNYKNYSATFTNMTPDDWLQKARILRLDTNFVSPITIEDFRGRAGRRWVIFTDKDNHVAYSRMADQHNQNHGWDLARRDGQIAFGGNAIHHAPQIDSGNKSSAVPTDPWYFLDKEEFKVAVEPMNYMRRTEPTPLSGSQPDSLAVFVNITLQTFVEDIRSQAVMASAA